MRIAQIARKTSETDIKISLDLDGGGRKIDTGCGFLDHMLELFSCHSGIGLEVFCRGDVKVDYHHTAEDVAIALGKAISDALGERRGIVRYGSTIIPMDESLVLAAVDLGGRSALGFCADFPTEKVGDFDTELVKEFFAAMARSLAAAIHIREFCGDNSHHIAEAVFKAFARAMKIAVSLDGNAIPSSKGSLV